MNRDDDFRYDVFLSYSRTDAAAVEQIAARLVDQEQLSPFLDRWHLVPGQPWQEAIEQAIDQECRIRSIPRPSGPGGWATEETRAALDARQHVKNFRVIPVLLPGFDARDGTSIPLFLRAFTWVDFRSGLDDAEAFRRLVAAIRGEVPGPHVSRPAAGTSSERSKLLASTIKGSFLLP